MKAIRYLLPITTDIIHNWTQEIDEYHIPEINISFNCLRNQTHIFETYEGRYQNAVKTVEVDIPDDLAKSLKNFVTVRKDLEKQLNEFDDQIILEKELY
jgi:hypothetical protein